MQHAEQVKAAPTVAFVARLMRLEGVIASPEILRNSVTFKELWPHGLHETEPVSA